MQRAHFQVRVGVFSCQDKYLFRYLWYKKKIECGLAWSVLLSTSVVDSRDATEWVRNKLATSQSARFALVTSAAYTHGQIVDAELANQSARFALVML